MKETLSYNDYEKIIKFLGAYIDLIAPFDFEDNADTIEEAQEIIDKITQGGYDLPY